MQLTRVVLTALVLAQAATVAIFETELWPEEGRPVFAAASDRLTLYDEPTGSAKQVVQVAVVPGQAIPFDQTRYRTFTAGRFRALRDTEIAGLVLGQRSYFSLQDYSFGSFPLDIKELAANQTVEYLQYRAEGTCFVRFNTVVIDARPCPTENPAFRLETMPVVEWWIHLALTDKPNGWIIVSDRTVKLIARKG